MSDTTTTPPDPLRDPLFGDLSINWKWMLGLGIFMAVLGLIGLGMTYALTIVSVIWFGVLVIIGGVAQLIDAFKCSGWKSVAGHVVLGLVYLAAGVILIAMPVQSAWWLTLFIGATFVASGIMRIIMAFQMRDNGGAAPFWLGVSGAISVFLGALIFSIVDFPDETALSTVEAAQSWFGEWGWVIGLFVAIEFIVHGAALIGLAFVAKDRGEGNTPPTTSDGPPAAAA
ncbi:MAG: HdeD family acid-resistance protein [Pseudomonadota bacterium]